MQTTNKIPYTTFIANATKLGAQFKIDIDGTELHKFILPNQNVLVLMPPALYVHIYDIKWLCREERKRLELMTKKEVAAMVKKRFSTKGTDVIQECAPGTCCVGRHYRVIIDGKQETVCCKNGYYALLAKFSKYKKGIKEVHDVELGQ